MVSAYWDYARYPVAYTNQTLGQPTEHMLRILKTAESDSDLAQLTPNLTLQNNPSFSGVSNSASIYIRGVGQQDFVPTVEPGVGVYVDGVYVARSVGAILDLVHFERIEVLRGPQGTLFGCNIIGGAISITTKAPDDRLGASASATYGTDNLVVLKGMVNVPLGEKAALRVSAGSRARWG